MPADVLKIPLKRKPGVPSNGSVSPCSLPSFWLWQSMPSPVFRMSGKLRKEASQLAWERATFPKLDAWYASGDYDSILEFIDNPEASEYSLSRWKHASFLWAYLDYSIIHDYRNQKERGCSLFSVCPLYLDSFERMTQKEQKLVEGYRKEGENLLSQVYHMSKEALIEYYEEEYTP